MGSGIVKLRKILNVCCTTGGIWGNSVLDFEIRVIKLHFHLYIVIWSFQIASVQWTTKPVKQRGRERLLEVRGQALD